MKDSRPGEEKGFKRLGVEKGGPKKGQEKILQAKKNHGK